MNRAIVLSALFLLAAGCTADPEVAPSAYAASLAAGDAALILDLVNYPGTDLDTLDHAIGLDGRAAKGIVAARNGADQLSPSSDDVPFATIEELDSVPFVGDAAFTKLRAYALAHPVPSGEIVEGVTFAGWQAQATIWGVNNTSLSELDGLLDARAASALFAHRPYATVAAMGPQSFVGTGALAALRGHAGVYWNAMHAGGTASTSAGTFDGVAFDDATARTALEISMLATQAQLVAHGVTVSIASKIIAGRPYATLAAVSNVTGVGTATMQALSTYAKSGTWAAPAPLTFLLDAAALADITTRMKESLYEDEGFAETLHTLGGSDDAQILIATTLETEIDRLAAPLLGTSYTDADSAADHVAEIANVKQRVRDGGWAYLGTLGLVPPGAATCTASFTSAVQPHLADLLLMSESDRVIDLVSFPGAGATAPTAASVLATVPHVAGSTSQLRTVDHFYMTLEPASDTADPAAAGAVEAAVTAQLHDVVYVAVFKPRSDPYHAEVDIYLVGRTACGDLVGLHSVAVET